MSSFRGGRNSRSGRGSNSNNQQSSSSSGGTQPRFQPCRNFSSGTCPRGDSCSFAHVIKMHASAEASEKKKEEGFQRYNSGRGGGKTKEKHGVTSVSVWESGGSIKLFTGSHDGKWRLWATASDSQGRVSLNKEFEHFVGGLVDSVHIASHYFFCGFEACPKEAPEARAGMVHSWNLNAAQDPPLELWMGPLSRYAGTGRIRSVCTAVDGRVWTGAMDGAVRQWAFDPRGNQGKGAFSLVRTMCGHIGGVAGLALVGTMLWSGGLDGTIRLWNVDTGENAHLIPCLGSKQTPPANGGAAPKGHAGSISGLLPFEAPNGQGSFLISSSVDTTVKVWNATNGDCVASESHGQGVSAIALASDTKGTPLLLCGLQYGDIMIRGTISNPPLVLLLKLSHNFIGVGHDIGPVNDIQSGPGNTFYTVADDGKLTVWQITGDFRL